MWRHGFVSCLLVGGASILPALAQRPSNGCDLSSITNIRELHDTLNNRVVEAIKLASSGGREERLRQIVESSATFSSGSGDVGIPLGQGLAGIRALAMHMNADEYRTLDWDYMPYPISDACKTHEASVEFINKSMRETFTVKFKFNAGRIVSAQGWGRSFSTGALPPVRK